MKLTIEKDTLKRLASMLAGHAATMRQRLVAIAADPFAAHANVKPLAGMKDAFRLRVGEWRAVYVVDRTAQLVRVRKIDARGEIYR